jgi:hypothetical protein
MDKEFIGSVLVVLLFLVLKFIEATYIEKETLPLKVYVKEALMVGVAAFAGSLGVAYLYPLFNYFIYNITDSEKIAEIVNPPVFTDEPGF